MGDSINSLRQQIAALRRRIHEMSKQRIDKLNEQVAKRFHETYERLAPDFGYETRPESAVAWEDVPENNRKLMIAVAAEVTKHVAKMLNDVQYADEFTEVVDTISSSHCLLSEPPLQSVQEMRNKRRRAAHLESKLGVILGNEFEIESGGG